MPSPLVLSLFPGIGLLDRAFEEEGFCVVRGPDVLWGGDVHGFHPPAGKFDGVIGGPPCQRWSRLANIVRAVHGESSLAPDLIPEFARCIQESNPGWWLMENVPGAPLPNVGGYYVTERLINNRWFGGIQNRERRFTFGSKGRASFYPVGEVFEALEWQPAVTSTAGGRRRTVAIGGNGKPKGNQRRGPGGELNTWTLPQMCELQGLSQTFLADAPFTVRAKQEVIGNGVPLPMGRAVARAVKAAMYPDRCELQAVAEGA
jgi:DNA (cytosine-5)-methyltransferase 1